MVTTRRATVWALWATLWLTSSTRLWSAEASWGLFVMDADGSAVRRLPGVSGYHSPRAPRWSHDGTRLVYDALTAGSDVRRWFLVDAVAGSVRPMGVGEAPDWSPDDKQLVFSVAEKSLAAVGVWAQNVDGGGRLRIAEMGAMPRWSPAGDALAVVDGRSLTIVDLVAGGKRTLEMSVVGFDWSPDGSRLAVVSAAGETRTLWLVDVADFGKQTKLHTGPIDGSVNWSPDGKRLAVSIGNRLHVISAEGGGMPTLIAGQEGENQTPAWSPDGRQIAFVSTRTQPAGAAAPVAGGARSAKLVELKRHQRGKVVYGLDVSKDGRKALLGGKNDLGVWNLEDDSSELLPTRGEWVRLSPGGNMVALCGPLIKVTLANAETGKLIRDLHTGSMCTNADFSPDGKRLVCGTIDKQAIAFDVDSGKRLCTFDDHHAPITRTSFLPTGEAISNGQDKQLRIWNPETAKQRLAIAHPEVPWGLAVSPDGRLIATGTGGVTEGNPIMQRILPAEDYTVRLWDADTGKLVREMKGHTGVVYVLAFAPDGRTLVSGSWDGSIRLWDVPGGQELATVQGQGSAYAVAVTPDGRKLVVGGGENRTAGAPLRRYRDEEVRLYEIVEGDGAAGGAP